MRIGIIVALVAGILVVAVLLLNRPRLVRIDAAVPENFPADRFSHDILEQLLQTYVDGAGDVDYARWQQNAPDLQRLESYLAAVSRYSPESTPERFKTKQDELAYWLYAYNAYVVKSILDRWPLASVTSVKAPIEIVKGLGFFYQLRFVFGGKEYSLYAVENDIIRASYRDARIHFVLNCGSESCPVLRPELPSGTELESYLQQAAVDFVSDQQNVSIDHDKKEIVLSAIFKWFRKDFINDLRRRGLSFDRGLIDYVASVAPASLREELLGTINYEIVYIDYDWAVNQHK
ncbi:MAG: DUF547 domain-containing protein [Woeseiaceae bacterium]|nr:DUF547 domain-containing protein [Woeseiaceae bacterium]